jgi:hypothetical protein
MTTRNDPIQVALAIVIVAFAAFFLLRINKSDPIPTPVPPSPPVKEWNTPVPHPTLDAAQTSVASYATFQVATSTPAPTATVTVDPTLFVNQTTNQDPNRFQGVTGDASPGGTPCEGLACTTTGDAEGRP